MEEFGLNNSNNKNSCDQTSKNYCLITKDRHHKLMNLVLFCVWEEVRIWTH